MRQFNFRTVKNNTLPIEQTRNRPPVVAFTSNSVIPTQEEEYFRNVGITLGEL